VYRYSIICGAALILGMSLFPARAADPVLKVGITEQMPFLDVTHEGNPVRIQRIQDQGNKLIDDFAKTSRPCPPFCIHPIKAAPGVDTVGELELLDFMRKEVKEGRGLIIDSRLPEFYRIETIPTAVNIPFTVIRPDNKRIDLILNVLGAVKAGSTWDFRNAKSLALFCNGPWCDQSSRAIQALIGLGYPPEKLKYYRDGMQLWRVLGLTTVVPAKKQP
jgi:rhodanese-related sulfurtransferase